jgi:DnaJ family protein B protein 4
MFCTCLCYRYIEGLKGGAGSAGGGGFPGGAAGGFPGGFSFQSFGGNGGPQGSFRGFQPRDANDIFSQFFGGGSGGGAFSSMFGGGGGHPMHDSDEEGGGNPFAQFGMGGGGGGGQRAQRQAKAAPIVKTLTLTLEELYNGADKKLRITRQRKNDQGQYVATPKIVEIKIKPGWKAGTKITYEKEGDERPGEIPADIVFEIAEQKHNKFTRKGDDLLYTQPLSLTQALTGFQTTFNGIDNKPVNLDLNNQIIQPNTIKIIKGRGMPISKQPGQYGDLRIEFNIIFPKHPLNDAQKQKIKEANLG